MARFEPNITVGDEVGEADLERFFEELEVRDGSGCAKLLVCRVAAKASAHPEKELTEAEREV